MLLKKVVITGATGQDGSYMIEYLLKNTENFLILALRRASVPTTERISHLLNHPRVKTVFVDLNDAHSMDNLIQSEKPDYFINFAALSFVGDSWQSPAAYMQTNAVALIHILEAVRRHAPDCRVYSAGTSEQWGDVKYSPQDEVHPMSPRSVYGVAKCAASHLCKVYRESYGLYITHGILLNHESERRGHCFVTRKITLGLAKIVHQLHNNQPVTPIELGNLDAKRDWSHAEDFVDGVWRMLNQDVYNKTLNATLNAFGQIKNGTKFLSENISDYVLSSNETHSIREFIETACLAAHLAGNWRGRGLSEEYFVTTPDGAEIVIVKINPAFYRPAEVELLHGNSNKIRKELEWSPKVSFWQLVSRMVESDINNLK